MDTLKFWTYSSIVFYFEYLEDSLLRLYDQNVYGWKTCFDI